MPVSRGDLDIRQGMDYSGTVTVANGDGTPADLSGCSGARAQLRTGAADHYEVAAEVVCAIELPDKVRMSIPKAVTVTLCGRYQWELELLPQEEVVLAGSAIVAAEVTREVVMAATGGRR